SNSKAVGFGRSGCASTRTAIQPPLGYRGGIRSSLLFAHTAVDAADEHRDLVPEIRADSTETDQLRDSTCRVSGSLFDNFSNEPKLLRVRYLSPLASFAVDIQTSEDEVLRGLGPLRPENLVTVRRRSVATEPPASGPNRARDLSAGPLESMCSSYAICQAFEGNRTLAVYDRRRHPLKLRAIVWFIEASGIVGELGCRVGLRRTS